MANSLTIRKAIERETEKLISRHNAKAASRAQEHKRYLKRSGVAPATPTSTFPLYWSEIRDFNPYYIRSRLRRIYKAISPKVRLGTYAFGKTLRLEIPKPDGGVREISLSTVLDSAVAYWLGKRLIRRNSYIFSSYAYAYRDDRSAHHALLHLSSELRRVPRVYSVEFDFANYFGSIEHEYLYGVLESEFQVSQQELTLIRGILSRPQAPTIADYAREDLKPTTVGIPQGSMLSLFLANVAALELDRKIEKTGVVFARYADDTVVLADSYNKAHECAAILLGYGAKSGTSVNISKSPGISLVTPLGKSEFSPKQTIEFLGHALSSTGIEIAPKSIARIKRKVGKTIHDNLLLQAKRDHFNAGRLGPGFFDWDLLTLVNELRRYVYGRLTEDSIRAVISNEGRPNLSRNVMSFYPFVESAQAKELDGWLIDVVLRAYAHRRRLLHDKHGIEPATITREQLISGSWYDYPRVGADSRLPSFTRSLKYAKRVARMYDIRQLPSPGYFYGGL